MVRAPLCCTVAVHAVPMAVLAVAVAVPPAELRFGGAVCRWLRPGCELRCVLCWPIVSPRGLPLFWMFSLPPPPRMHRCGPCRVAFPHLSQLAQKHRSKGLVVLGVNMEEDSPQIRAFVQQQVRGAMPSADCCACDRLDESLGGRHEQWVMSCKGTAPRSGPLCSSRWGDSMWGAANAVDGGLHGGRQPAFVQQQVRGAECCLLTAANAIAWMIALVGGCSRRGGGQPPDPWACVAAAGGQLQQRC